MTDTYTPENLGSIDLPECPVCGCPEFMPFIEADGVKHLVCMGCATAFCEADHAS